MGKVTANRNHQQKINKMKAVRDAPTVKKIRNENEFIKGCLIEVETQKEKNKQGENGKEKNISGNNVDSNRGNVEDINTRKKSFIKEGKEAGTPKEKNDQGENGKEKNISGNNVDSN